MDNTTWRGFQAFQMVQSNRRRFPKQTFLIKIHQINLKKKFQPPSIDNTFKGFFIDFHFLSINISIYPTSKCPLTSSQPHHTTSSSSLPCLFSPLLHSHSFISTFPLSLFHFHSPTLTPSFLLSHSTPPAHTDSHIFNPINFPFQQ